MITKFNAWDKFEKKMILWKDMIKDKESEKLIPEILLNSERYVPLQFTGILDNKGEELYLHDNYKSEDYGDILTIYFINGAFTGGINPTLAGPLGWNPNDEGDDLVESNDFTDQMIKVGNIYEGLKIDL